jgi:hypothetical protein
MDPVENAGGTAVAEQQPQPAQKNKRGPKANSPSGLDFARAWNHPEVKTRQDVIKRLQSQGFAMSYSALVNRAKSYTDPERAGGAINLKELEEGQRGRRVDATAINEALAADALAGQEQTEDKPPEGETKE